MPKRYSSNSSYSGKRQKTGSSGYRRKSYPGGKKVTLLKMGYLNRRGLNRETGYVDLASAAYAANTTGAIVLAATIPQGAAVQERVGKKVLLKSMQVRGYVTSDAGTTATAAAWLIVYDKRPTGALPSITDILDTISVNSFLNDANSGRFKVLARRTYSLTGNATGVGQQTENSFIAVDEYIKLKGLQTIFKAAGTGAIGDIEEGAMYLVLIGITPAGPSDATIQLGLRTRYLDV